jgi:hypothetical protein
MHTLILVLARIPGSIAVETIDLDDKIIHRYKKRRSLSIVTAAIGRSE